MRLIGHLEREAAARQFADYLLVEGIASRLEQQHGEGWAIWVEDEDKVSEAKERLSAFRGNPSAPEFQGRADAAESLREKQAKAAADYRKRVVGRRHLFRPLAAYGFGPLTFVMIAASVVVFLLSRFGTNLEAIKGLFMTTARSVPPLPEIRNGEVWRLVTPIFVHFNVLHILFNMLWLRDLGSMIEARHSTLYLAVLVLLLAVGSNLGQFYLGGTPIFGGMSGVVYGLLGYVWLRGKFDPASGLFLHPTTVTMMIVWFVACWMPFFGMSIANYAHAVGLAMGMAWGYLSSLRYR